MKLDDIKIEQLHTQTLNNQDVRSLNPGQEQNARQLSLYKEELSKPIRFTYVEGKVLRFVAEAGDAEWSINIKKSILSLFQLDLAPNKIIKSPIKMFKEQMTGFTSEDSIRSAQEMPLVYPIYEESFGGICETLYEIDSNDNVERRQQQEGELYQTVEFQDVLNVTKTVNYKNCLTDPSVSFDRHSFHAKTQTIKGQLFSQQPSFLNSQIFPVPEELKQKYSNIYTNWESTNNVAQEVPVERFSYTKYNLTSAPESLVESRQVPVSSPSDMILIEGVYSEGKIKYEADGDQLISETQQSVKLISVAPTSDLARLTAGNQQQQQTVAGTQQLVNIQVREPSVPYETIQCELNSQKLKFYQAVWKYVQAKQQIQQQQVGQNMILNQQSQQYQQQNPLYSHQTVLPFALSASWYPIVATEAQSTESSLLESLNPDQLAKSYEQLLVSLAEDVLAEDVVDSKRAGEKVVRMINVIAFMPKYKLVQIHQNIIGHIKQAKLEQVKLARQMGKQQEQIDNHEVSKWKVVRKLYLDTLPLAGSKQAVEMIEALIEAQQVQSWEAKELCEAVPANLHYPDTEIIDAFVRLTQLPQVRKSRATFASCSIAVGKMIGSAYAKSKDASFKPTSYEPASHLPSQLREDDLVKQVVQEADPRRQLPIDWNKPQQQELYKRLVLDEQDLITYVNLFKQLLTKATKYHEKVIYIETLSHMKVPHVLPILEPFVTGRLSLAQCLGQQPLDINQKSQPTRDQQSQWYTNTHHNRQGDNKDWTAEQAKAAEECNYMRTIAIYSLAHISRVAPEQIQAMLLPVFDNTFEPYQMRIAAFTSMMVSPIDEHILERIASQMWREPSKEVASFVVGTIDTFSKFMSPQLSQFKIAALKASESMPKQYLDTWKFSATAGGDHFNQQKQTGASWLAEIIKSNVSSVPRGAYLHLGRFHGQDGSKFDNIFELGFTSKGIETLIKEYVAYNKQQSNEESNIVASIFENLYDSKDDLVKFYREARDEIRSSAAGKQEWTKERIAKKGKDNEDWEKDANIFIKRQQPIEGVNSQLGKQERKMSQLFEGLRNKRSVTFQAKSSQDDDEEPKMTIFSKLFEQTSYHALDRREIVSMIEQADDYVKMVAEKLVQGGKLHYVKLIMKSNNWHMVPSQLGLPVVVTHRTPIIVSLKVDASANGQETSTKLSQIVRQQTTGNNQVPNVLGHNFATPQAINITALVHPKIMMSNVRFLFACEQAQGDAYGVQTEKSHQISLPFELSVAYSQPKELVSVAVQPKTPGRVTWTKEVAKTFIGPISLSSAQSDNWLGRDHMIRVADEETESNRITRSDIVVPSLVGGIRTIINKPKETQMQAIEDLETPYKFQQHFNPQSLGLEIQLEGATDDLEVVRAIQKPSLAKETISQWTSTQDVDQPDQHSKSGPASDFLHIIESACNRPTKYLEFYTTIKADQQQQQSGPVYRFDFVLNNGNKQQQQKQQLITMTSQQQEILGGSSRLPITRLDMSKIQREIEQTKKFQQQQPIALEVY